MQLHSPVRRASLLVAGALAATYLVAAAPTASAAPVFVDAETQMDPSSGANTSSGGCITTPTTSTNTEVPVVENGPPVTVASSVTATSVNGGDTLSSAAQAVATGSVKSAGGQVSAIDLTMNGSAVLDAALPVSGCQIHMYAGAEIDFEFVVTQPVFMHLDFRSQDSAYSEVYLQQDLPSGPSPYYDHYGFGLKFSGTDTVYLPAGTYGGYFDGQVELTSNVDRSVTAAVSVKATFNVAGSQTEAVAGKGKKYVTFPAARSCATDSVDAAVTGKKKRASKVKQVKFFVNDKLVKKVRTPDKGDAVRVSVVDDVAAEVRAEVKLFPARKGRPGKVLEVTTAYEACS